MKKLALLLMVITAWAICESQGQAQVGYVTYYQPVMAQPVAVVSPPPVYYSSYYAPAPTIVAAPAESPFTLPRFTTNNPYASAHATGHS